MITKRVGREEREKASTLQDVSWRNVPVSSLRINSGAIWKTYLAPTCFSWQKRGKEKNWTESYFMGLSLSPVGSYNLKPPEQGWHSSTLSWFHWLSQQLPINRYLPGCLRAAGERQEQGMARDDDEGGETRQRIGEGKEKRGVGWSRAFSAVWVEDVFGI